MSEHPKKILLVDDSADNQVLIQALLSMRGMQCEVASNGLEGIQKATAQEFDIILMDMQMPVMDGYTATQQLRERGYRKPIIALTGRSLSEEKAVILQAGCDALLTKPLEIKELFQAIAEFSRE